MSVAEGVHYTLLCNLFVYTSHSQGCEHCSGGEHNLRPRMVVCEAGKLRGREEWEGLGRQAHGAEELLGNPLPKLSTTSDP